MSWTYLFVLSGAFLGWSLGANDAANVFGTAVGTRVLKYRTAIIICAVSVILGAALEGKNGIDNIGGYAQLNSVKTGLEAFLVMLMAALTVTGMTILKFPVSTSQCVIGSIIGWGLSRGTADFSKTTSFFAAWVITPVGAMIICFVLCLFVEKFVEGRIKGLARYDLVIKIGFIVSGAFGAYSLGSNNVANATGIYLKIPGILDDPFQAALIGGVAIALGVLTFSKPVMMTVGEGITALSPMTGFLVVISCSVIVFLYGLVGIPVSTSQGVVGAVIGAGLTKGVRNVNFKVLYKVFVAWFGTPTIPGLLSFLIGTYIIE